MGSERESLFLRLASPDEESRREAMAHLKAGLTVSELDAVLPALSDGSWRVRKEAIEGYSRVAPDPAFVETLVGLLHPDCEVILRNSVTEILERMGARVLPFLHPFLRIEQADTRKFLVDIVGNIGHPSSVDPLLEALRDPEDNVCAAAAEGLAKVGDRRAARGLLQVMEGADDWTAYSVLMALGRMRISEALPIFFRNLDKGGILAIPCVQGIGALGSVGDALLLLERLPRLARASVKAAFLAAASVARRAVSGPEGIAALRPLREAVSRSADSALRGFLVSQLAATEETEPRRDLLVALGLAGGADSLAAILTLATTEELAGEVELALLLATGDDPTALGGLLAHPEEMVRRRGLGVVARRGEKELLPLVLPLLADPIGHVRQAALQVLGQLGEGRDLDLALPLLEDAFGDVREAAADTLVVLGRKDPQGLLERIPASAQEPPETRTLFLRILAQVDAAGHPGVFLAALGDEDPSVRASAMAGLRRGKDPKSAFHLLTALTDESPQVRMEAAAAVGELAPPGAKQALAAAARDPDSGVRAAAVNALGGLSGVAPEAMLPFLEEEDVSAQAAAVEVLGRRAARGEIAALVMLGRVFARLSLVAAQAACRAAGGIPGGEALRLVRAASSRPEAMVRMFAAYTLAARPEDEARRRLAEMAEDDPDRGVRDAARSLVGGRR